MLESFARPKAWRILKFALALAAGFSAWAALGTGGCGGCQAAHQLLQGKSLAAVGAVYYAVLFAAAQLLGPSGFVTWGILLAAGIHAGLLAILVQAKIFCGPCVGTALAAAAALLGAIRCEPSNAFRASWVIPGAALFVQAWVLASGSFPVQRELEKSAERVADLEFAAPPVARGDVRLVVYTRPDCGYCIQFDREILPALVRDFGRHLHVERRSAENLPGIPTPTLILTGALERRFFPGLPELEDLRSTVRQLMEGIHGHETVLEKSR